MVHTKKGLTAITVAFDESLEAGSASLSGRFSVLGGVRKRKKTVYTKGVGIRGVSYDDNARTVTINLTKPYKGAVQVTVHGGIVAVNGASSSGDFTQIAQ